MIAETIIREESMASMAEEQKAVSKDVKALGRDMQAMNTKFGAMKEDIKKLHNSSYAELAERVASAEKLLKQTQKDFQKLRGSIDDCCPPSQQAEAKVAARADKLEKQLKVHREETWSRLADIENHCKSQEQGFHAELVKKVGRRELSQAVEDLRQQIFQVRGDVCCQIANIEHLLHASTQGIHGSIPGMYGDLLQAEAKGVIAGLRTLTSKQVTFIAHQEEEGTEIMQAQPTGFSLVHATHDEQMPECLPAHQMAHPPLSQSLQRNSASGKATHTVKAMQGYLRPASTRCHEDGRASHTTKSMHSPLRPSSARTRHEDVAAMVAEACRVQKAKSILIQPVEGKKRSGSVDSNFR